jgi:pimeloyl-ACP methyl ester carboxylesterase/DNA-binding SARP family transcriptional activator
MTSPLEIRLFGDLEVIRDGERVALPQSRKSRALLAYLVLKATPQRRDSLCEALWEAPDDPRAALRWSLTKLRPIVNDPDAERLVADRERAGFVALGASVDFREVQDACLAGLEALDTRQLEDLAAKIRGPLLAGLDLPGQPAFESWRMAQQETARQLHVRVLDELVDRFDADPVEQARRLRARLDIDPGNEDMHNRLVQALATSGARPEAEAQADLSRRVLRDFGGFDEARLKQSTLGAQRGRKTVLVRQPDPVLEPPLRQDIRFCNAADGVRIAYATVGKGPPLLKTANWMNHLEFDWESPVWRHMFRAFSADHTLIRYDSRGNGLSDWDAPELSLDAFVDDLKTVADAAGLDRFPLFAISQGCAVAATFAARYPERVSRMVLYGGYARGWRKRVGDEASTFKEQSEIMISLTRTGWGKSNPAYRQMFTSFFIPNATLEQMEWFNELQRITTSPENAARLLSAFGDLDASPSLPHVKCPTLVIHVRDDARITYGNGRELASGIPGARFVTLPGQNHLILDNEPAWPLFREEVLRFLAD